MSGRPPSRGPSRTSSLTHNGDATYGVENGYIVDRLTQSAGAERVKVVARVRPCIHDDEQSGAVEVGGDQRSIVVNRQETSVYPQTTFNFDTVLPLEANQHEVYNAAVRDIVGDVLRGYNGTVMVYGQTGAGKTYTLGNIEPHAIGMIPRAAAEIFKRAAEDKKQIYTITMAYIQIYMETIQDLLKPESDNLQLREDATNGVFVAGVHEQPVTSVEQCLHYLELGERNRVFAFTHMNAHSSRSHAVVMLTVRKRSRVMTKMEEAEMAKFAKDGVTPRRIKVGKLFLVDLAGSERLKKSKSEGLRQTEAIHINKSLSTLGNCINARANNSPHVPFRESKLTRLLQESLGGNTKTTLIICVSDVKQHMDETLQTLQFGSRAMCVRVKPMVNESIDYKAITDQVMSDLHDGQNMNGVLDALSKAQLNDLQEQFEQEKEHFHTLIAALEKEREEEGSQRKLMTETLKTKDQELQKQSKLLESHRAKLDSFVEEKAKLEKQVEDLKTQQRIITHKHEQEKSRMQASLADAITRLEAQQAQQQQEVSKLKQQLADKHRQMTQRHDREMQEALSSYEMSVKEAQHEWQQHADKLVQQKEREMKEAKAAAESHLREVRRKLETDIGEVKLRFSSLHERYCKLQESERRLQDEHAEAIQLTQDLTAQLKRVQTEKEIHMSANEASGAECQALKDALLQLVSVASSQIKGVERSWKTALDKQDARLTQAQTRVAEVGAAYDRLQMERDGLSEKVHGRGEELRAKEGKIAKLDTQVSELTAALVSEQTVVKDLTTALQSSQRDCKDLTAELYATEAQVQDLTAALTSAEANAKDLTGQLHAAQAQSRALEHELHAAQAQSRTLDHELQAAKAEIQDFVAKLRASENHSQVLTTQLHDSKSHANDLSSELAASQANSHALSVELAATRDNVNSLSTALQSAETRERNLNMELHVSRSKAADLDARLQVSQASVEQLTIDLQHAHDTINDMESKIADHVDTIGDREADISALSAELKSTQGELSDVQAQLNSALELGQQQENEIMQLRHEAEDRNVQIRGLESDLEATRQLVKQQEGVIGEQEGKIQELQMELDERAEQLEEKEQDVETLSAKVEVLESELQKAHRNRLSLEQQLERHHANRVAALQARSFNHRRERAARTIQKAWHTYRTRRLKMHLHEHGTTINRLDKARSEWQNTAYQFEAKQRKAMAQWGADRCREAVSTHMKVAVENIMATFVLPKKELEAFISAKNRMNHFSGPMVSPSPASMGNLSPMHAGLHRNSPSPFHPTPGHMMASPMSGTPKGATTLFRSPKSAGKT